jgi:Tfp pilus assembly protein PilO
MKNYLISIFVILIITLGLLQFLVLPPYEQFMSLRLQLDQKETELQNRSTHLSEMINLSQKLKQDQITLAKISSSLPFRTDVPSLFRFIQQKSSETGMILKDIAFQKALLPEADKKASGEIGEITFSATVNGSFQNFVSFLQQIEDSSRLFKITSIGLKQEGETRENVRNVFHLSLGANFLKD